MTTSPPSSGSRSEGELATSSSEDESSSSSSNEESSKSSNKEPLKFKNDGSFLETFKKLQEEKTSAPVKDQDRQPPETAQGGGSSSSAQASQKKPGLMSIVGKRRGRGGKVLPTGLVKKQKREDEAEEDTGKKDAWSQYMSEVKKYKERLGDEEDKNRPLVK